MESHRDEDHYGYIGRDQINRIDDCYRKLLLRYPQFNLDTACKIALVHHPLFAPDDKDGSSMRDPIYFFNWVKRQDISIVLHGHQHHARSAYISDGIRGFVAIGAGSIGGNAVQRNDSHISLNLIRIDFSGLGPKTVRVLPGGFRRTLDDWCYENADIQHFKVETPHRSTSEAAGRIGLKEILRRLEITQLDITEGRPVSIEGGDSALTAYIEAIPLSYSLRATSFLHSQFWSDRLSDKILKANRDLANRVQDARRIFLTTEPIESYIPGLVQRAYARHMAGSDVAWTRLTQTNNNMRELAKEFKIKIVDVGHYNSVHEEFDPSRHELAIYQLGKAGPWRIDIFDMSEEGRILGVRVIADQAADEVTCKQLCNAFDEAWQSEASTSVEAYISSVQEEMERVQTDIAYTKNGLRKFDSMVKRNDKILTAESDILVSHLKRILASRQDNSTKSTNDQGKKRTSRNKQRNRFDKYLDVGVCTGRYPLLLRSKNIVGQIFTTDIDYDVEDFMKDYHKNIKFTLGDIRESRMPSILGGNFDLITCMLGTCCHFGLQPQARWGGVSGFSAAVKNMIKMLNLDGILIMSAWNNDKDNRLINIYSDYERQRLLNNSPNAFNVKESVNLSGYDCNVEKVESTSRLTLYSVEKLA